MADQIEENEPAARAANVANQGGHFIGPQMVGHQHREGYIGRGQTVLNGISAQDWERRVRGDGRAEIDAHDIDSEAPLNVT